MKLLRAEIKNFRSIAELIISFETKCRILIGINESGKSNILRALHLLDPEVPVQRSDLRIERLDEPQVVDGWVRYVFELATDEVTEIVSALTASFDPGSIDKPLLQTKDRTISASQWMAGPHQGLYIVTLPSGKRTCTTWSASKLTTISSGWFKNNSSDILEIIHGETNIVIPPKGFAWIDESLSQLPEALEKATLNQFHEIINSYISTIVKDCLPECIFWKYSDQYLLPSTIDITAFCNNPNTCIPLKSMFELAGYDITQLLKTITIAREQGQHRYTQILEKTASAATKHIQQIWKDYKTVRLKLEANAETISPMVIDDQVPLDMANRSDGFKRFISFLLQISAKVKTSELQGALILVDEPEIGIHPSGCRHLLEELVRIGESNATVFSTHSIFMIDKENIDRHLVVEKKKEVTTIWQAEKARIQDEEVLYSAMGYSVFETLKGKNVIFEGWRDKYIYSLTKAAMEKVDPALKSRLESIGVTHSNGVKDIKNVAKFMELAARSCLIISDADQPALEHKRHYEEPGAWGEWKTLQDIFGPGSFVTAEDLITPAAIIKRANKFKSSIPDLPELTETMLGGAQSTLYALEKWLMTINLDKKEHSKALADLKSALFNNLKYSELKNEAELLVRFIDDYKFS